MPQDIIEGNSPEGLYARPAAVFVKLANGVKTTITVRLNGCEANGECVMSVMALGANAGVRVDIDIRVTTQLRLPGAVLPGAVLAGAVLAGAESS